MEDRQLTYKKWNSYSLEHQTLLSYAAFIEAKGYDWRGKELYKLWKESGISGDWRTYTAYLLKKRDKEYER